VTVPGCLRCGTALRPGQKCYVELEPPLEGGRESFLSGQLCVDCERRVATVLVGGDAR
jgi:hypothetical protein